MPSLVRCCIGCHRVRTVQGRPSTVLSLKDWPTVKETWVVRTLVDVLMDRLSPCWVISTDGLEAACTAIFRRKTFTPGYVQTELMLNTISVVTKGIEIFQIKDLFLDLLMKHSDSYHVVNVWSDHVVPWDSPAKNNTKEEIIRDKVIIVLCLFVVTFELM